MSDLVKEIESRFRECDLDCADEGTPISTEQQRKIAVQFIGLHFQDCPAFCLDRDGWLSVVIQPPPHRDRRATFRFDNDGTPMSCQVIGESDQISSVPLRDMDGEDIQSVIAWAEHRGDLPSQF